MHIGVVWNKEGDHFWGGMEFMPLRTIKNLRVVYQIFYLKVLGHCCLWVTETMEIIESQDSDEGLL
jgi:hypothetical protein